MEGRPLVGTLIQGIPVDLREMPKKKHTKNPRELFLTLKTTQKFTAKHQKGTS